jgi:hypothetical protein
MSRAHNSEAKAQQSKTRGIVVQPIEIRDQTCCLHFNQQSQEDKRQNTRISKSPSNLKALSNYVIRLTLSDVNSFICGVCSN